MGDATGSFFNGIEEGLLVEEAWESPEKKLGSELPGIRVEAPVEWVYRYPGLYSGRVGLSWHVSSTCAAASVWAGAVFGPFMLMGQSFWFAGLWCHVREGDLFGQQHAMGHAKEGACLGACQGVCQGRHAMEYARGGMPWSMQGAACHRVCQGQQAKEQAKFYGS